MSEHIKQLKKNIWVNLDIQSYRDCVKLVFCPEPTDLCYANFNKQNDRCELCPGINHFKEKFTSALQENNMENVTYKQWTNVDRCSIETFIKSVFEFVDSFGEQLQK